jgi:hypothetical protein
VASIGSLIVELVAKTGQFETDTGRAARTAEKRAQEIEKSFSRMGSRIKRAFAGLAAGISFAAIVRATSEAEKAMAALENAVRNNAGAAGLTAPQLAKMSSELQGLTTYSDDAIQSSSALLLAFKQIGGGEFKRAQIAVLDLATALQKDLSSASLLVGKALANPVKGLAALSKAGIELEKPQQALIKRLVETGRSAEAQRILLSALESQFGGAAAAARNTFGGALQGLKNAFGDLLEAKGGMPEAVDKLNELSALLQDPATVAGAEALTSGLITGFATAAKLIAGTARGVKSFGEFIAHTIHGADTQLGQLEDSLKDVETRLKATNELSKSIKPVALIVRLTGSNAELKKDLEAQRAVILNSIRALKSEQAKLEVATQGGAGAAGSAGSGADVLLPPSEDFVKLQAQLQQQIALYGKVGEAAKLAYLIQSGALKDVTDAEGKQLLTLAKQYDAQVKVAEAEKQLRESRERSQTELTKMAESLEREVATFGKGTVAVLEYDFAHGELGKRLKEAGPAFDSVGAKVLDLTKKLEENKRVAEGVEETFRQFDKLKDDAAAVFEATRTPLERYNAELERLILLRNTLKDGKPLLDDESFERAKKAAQDAFHKAGQDSERFSEQFKDGVFRSLGDGIYTAMTDGAKRGWKGFLDAGIETINRLVAQALAKRLAEGLFGGGKGDPNAGGGGGFLATAGKFLGSIFGGGRATGGPVSSGTLYRINEREPEFFRPNVGGKVIPLSKMGSSGGNVTQNIMVQGRSDLRTARQMQVEASRQQRIATARLG